MGGEKLADLEWGVTMRGEPTDFRVVYPDGYDERTAVVRYFALAERRVVRHNQVDEPLRGRGEVVRTEILRDERRGLNVPWGSVGEARKAAEAFVNLYVFDPAEATG